MVTYCLSIGDGGSSTKRPGGEAPGKTPEWMKIGTWRRGILNFLILLCRPEPPNEFYDGDHDNDKESDVEI